MAETEYPGIDRSELVAYLRRMSSDPGTLYKWMKRIDGDPRPGGSALMTQRVLTFCDLHRRQIFYEPLSGHRSIMKAMAQVARVEEGAWVAPDKRDLVHMEFDIFESAYAAPHGRLDLPRPGEQPIGVHAVAVAGWEESGEILRFRNSWGVGWGDRGYGSVSREYLEHHLRDTWLSRNARYGFTRFDLPALSAARTARETASIWLRENGRWPASIKHRGVRRRLYLYDAWSVEDDVPVTVIELRTGEDFRIGWAMLFHERDRTSVLKELFVWPGFRRLGLGTLIEQEAVDIARVWESTKMQIYLHSVDAIFRNRVAGSFFARRSGYQWVWHRKTLPNLEAIGEKTI